MDDVYLHNTISVIRKSPDIKTYIWRVFMSWHGTDMSAMMSFIIEIAILGLSPTFFMVGHYRTHTDPLFIKYNVLNVYDIYKLETGVFMSKYSKGSLPDGYNNFFITRSKIHDYHTRYKDHFIKQEMLEPFQITQSELMGQYIVIHWITMLKSQIQ